MMTYLTPFERTGYDLFRSMRDWENEFFGEKSTAMSSCKTDIRDTGDSYVLEAELPGFQKDEIKISVESDTLTLSAVHKEKTEEERQKTALISVGNAAPAPMSRNWTSAMWTLPNSMQFMKTAC